MPYLGQKTIEECTIEEVKEKLDDSMKYQAEYVAETGRRSKIHDRRIKSLTAELESRL